MQLAISRNLDLVEICGVNPLFDIFCVMFEQASFSMAMRAYANNVGLGVQFAFEATMQMKDGFDIVEDLIGWPAVSITMSFFFFFFFFLSSLKDPSLLPFLPPHSL